MYYSIWSRYDSYAILQYRRKKSGKRVIFLNFSHELPIVYMYYGKSIETNTAGTVLVQQSI